MMRKVVPSTVVCRAVAVPSTHSLVAVLYFRQGNLPPSSRFELVQKML